MEFTNGSFRKKPISKFKARRWPARNQKTLDTKDVNFHGLLFKARTCPKEQGKGAEGKGVCLEQRLKKAYRHKGNNHKENKPNPGNGGKIRYFETPIPGKSHHQEIGKNGKRNDASEGVDIKPKVVEIIFVKIGERPTKGFPPPIQDKLFVHVQSVFVGAAFQKAVEDGYFG